MNNRDKYTDYDALPLVLEVNDIQNILGISRTTAYIFAEIRTGPLIIKILKDYTKDIKDILPDDLKPYVE